MNKPLFSFSLKNSKPMSEAEETKTEEHSEINKMFLTFIPDEPDPLEVPNFCANCDVPEAKFNCSKCKKIFYCSQNCQKEDWKNHKKLCESQSSI